MSLDNSFIDINCDLGEIDPSLNLEKSIMPLIDRCNIASGGHAGDRASIQGTILLAQEHEVKIGIHPSYDDPLNFGRVRLKISNHDLMDSLRKQIDLFKEIATQENVEIDHIKAHGALYHYLSEDEEMVHLYLDSIQQNHPELKVMIPPYSVISRLAKEYSLNVIHEAFADRKYQTDRKLVSRQIEGSVLKDPDEVVKQVNSLVKDGGVYIDETFVGIQAESICVHSDTENSIEILKAIRAHC